jgi:hypothetical protein
MFSHFGLILQTVAVPSQLLLVICAIGLLVAIIVPPIWLFTHKPPARVQYRVIVFLLIFVLASIMALLFGIDSTLKSDGWLPLKIAGPFAAFLGASVIILRFFDYEDDAPLEQNKDFLQCITELIEATERKCEWIAYEHWKLHLNGYEEINGQEEEHFLRNILGGAYSPSESAKVQETHIATAFLYLTNSVIKLQRVRGKAIETPTKIRFRSHSSYGSQGLRSIIFIAEVAENGSLVIRKAVSDLDPPQNVPEGYARIDYRQFDCLILTEYSEYPRHEDYILVDVSRFSRENSADMSLAIVSTDRPIKAPDVWQMRRATVSTQARLPLAFRKFRTPPRTGWVNVMADFEMWLTLLDGYQPVRDTVRDAIAHIKSEMNKSSHAINGNEEIKFSEMLRSLENSNSYHFQAQKGSDTMLALFTWQ